MGYKLRNGDLMGNQHPLWPGVKQKPQRCQADPSPRMAAATPGGCTLSTRSQLYPYAKHHICTFLYENTLNNPYKEGDKTRTEHVSQFPQKGFCITGKYERAVSCDGRTYRSPSITNEKQFFEYII